MPAPGGGLYALNVSFPTALQDIDDSLAEHAALLLALAQDIRKTWEGHQAP